MVKLRMGLALVGALVGVSGCGAAPTCTPQCAARVCGDDTCGGSCGNCATGSVCAAATGTCVGQCTPQCNGKNCGSDGCGATCGTCTQGFTCNGSGSCVAGCTPSCNGKTCGPDGCTGSCGTCAKGFTCGTTGTCAIDPTSLWIVTVTTGQIAQFDSTGAAWDVPGGAPDPFVCLTINSVRNCTSVKSDIFTPTWNESFPQATALMTGVNIEIWDEDLTSDDVICPAGMLGVSQQSFVARTWGAMCTYGSFSATLVPK